MKKLLIEHVSTIQISKSSLVESMQKNDGHLIVRNVLLQRADVPNANRRIYPKRILERELNKYFSKITDRRAFGECDHANENVVNLKNVCQAIVDARWVGNEIYGDVQILNTPAGNIIREILLAGFRVGQSSRGLGSVEPLNENEDDLVEVQDDFEFVTLADAVSDESTYGANMTLHESRIVTSTVNLKYEKINKLITEIRCDLSGICCIK